MNRSYRKSLCTGDADMHNLIRIQREAKAGTGSRHA